MLYVLMTYRSLTSSCVPRHWVSAYKSCSHIIIFKFYSLHLRNQIPSTAIPDLHGITAYMEFSFRGNAHRWKSGAVRFTSETAQKKKGKQKSPDTEEWIVKEDNAKNRAYHDSS